MADSSPLPAKLTRYSEEQRFRQPWVWTVLLAIAMGSTVLIAYFGVTRFLLGDHAADRPLSDQLMMTVSIATVGVVWILTTVLYQVRLTTRVSLDRLQVHLAPLSEPLTVLIRDIQGLSICRYRPILDYGGWGTRHGKYGQGYTITGDRGVRVLVVSGESFLIGSQRPEELLAALEHARSEPLE